jgi:hypothetical protein
MAPFSLPVRGVGKRTLFDKIAQRFWTHAVRPEGASRRRRRVNPTLSANISHKGLLLGPLCLGSGYGHSSVPWNSTPITTSVLMAYCISTEPFAPASN